MFIITNEPMRRPPHGAELVRAHQLARRAVGLRGVGDDVALEPDDLADQLRQFQDGHILARADIDVLEVRIGLHQKHAGVGAVVGVEELAARRARAPDRDAVGAGQLGLVSLADQGRHHVAAVEVEIVALAVEVGRHGADEVAAVLLAIGLGQLDAGDLGDRVPLVGRLQRAGQQAVLADRLRRRTSG
jgi:hypothetical protein